MYYIGLDVHKKTISYCIKDVSGQVQREGTIPATRTELDSWMKTLPKPWTVAMEASIFTGWERGSRNRPRERVVPSPRAEQLLEFHRYWNLRPEAPWLVLLQTPSRVFRCRRSHRKAGGAENPATSKPIPNDLTRLKAQKLASERLLSS